MVEVNFSQELVDQALTEAEELGKLKGSITNGDSNAIGMLGELLVQRYLDCDRTPTYDYDLVHKTWRLDVKTKGCTCVPQDCWDASIADWNTRQDCDAYVFVRVQHLAGFKDIFVGKAWIFGWMPKEEYFESATFHSKGSPDPKHRTWKFSADCWNLEYSRLHSIKHLVSG